MAPKSNVLKLITLVALTWLLIIVLMNIFNSGQSYYYINKDSGLQKKQNHHQHLIQVTPDNKLQTSKLNADDQLQRKAHYSSYVPTDEDLIPIIEQKLPNLPFGYFNRNKYKGLKKTKNCAVYPALQTLNFYNTYWQTYHNKNITFHLYGAYYDERLAVDNGPVVRILAMSNHLEAEFPLSFCQIWFEGDSRPIITKVIEYKLIWRRKWGLIQDTYMPYLIACKMPERKSDTSDPIPQVVNLVQNECDTASNSLKIIYEKPQTMVDVQDFAVCVKGLDFLYQDISRRLIEWLEMLKLLGVHKVYFYHLTLHPNVFRVLKYYVDQGFIEVKNTSLVGGVVGIPELDHWLIQGYKLNKRLNELIPYNDCFYRNMYKYKHIALLDIDEVIMPKGDLTDWRQLVEYAQSFKQQHNCSNGFSSLCAPHVFFPSTNDSFSYTGTFMLNHPYRSRKFMERGYNTKCLHNTQQVLTLHNHYPLAWLKSCKPLDLNDNVCQLQHYREQVKSEYTEDLLWDDNMERFRHPLEERYSQVLKDLKLLK